MINILSPLLIVPPHELVETPEIIPVFLVPTVKTSRRTGRTGIPNDSKLLGRSVELNSGKKLGRSVRS